jgi:hypothetical protein
MFYLRYMAHRYFVRTQLHGGAVCEPRSETVDYGRHDCDWKEGIT